jgi:transposase
MSESKTTYTPMPQVPEGLKARYEATLAVLSGAMAVSAAARRLGLSRVQFQTVMHRALQGLLEGLTPKAAGRPSKPLREQELEREVEKLRRENERLLHRTQTIDRLLGVASGMLQGRTKASGRTPRSTSKTGKATPEPEDPDGAVNAAREMRALGLTETLTAAVLGVSPATLRRRLGRASTGRRTGGARAVLQANVDAHTAALAEDVVRATHGLVGAEALRHAVEGLSRRQAAAIKHDTLRTLEHERRYASARVEVTVPGVVRGFDQLWVGTPQGLCPVLVSADACVPYRTSLVPAARYDGRCVAEAVDADFRAHGAPLVWRADQASCHRTAEVDEVLRGHGVLWLHGPAHLARYYGQLERQNREHRAWLDAHGELELDALREACARMVESLNRRWPRRALHWRTASEVWATRPIVSDDRDALRAEVVERAERLTRDLHAQGRRAQSLATRFAIEGALAKRGYLRQQLGGWVLRDYETVNRSF